MATTKLKSVKICFYCKHIVKGSKCTHCNRAPRFIKIDYNLTKLTPWWNIFKPKYKIEVINPNFKYIEFQIKDMYNC